MAARLRMATGALRRGLRIASALASGRPTPLSITFILTHRCNLRCDYCDVPAAAAEEMDTGAFERAIDELLAAGMVRASFSGGEALLRADAAGLIARAHAGGAMTSLNTNGWLADGQLEAVAPVLDQLMVSLDGPAAVHDHVRGRAGGHKRALETLIRGAELGIATSSIAVLGPWNVDHLDDILASAAKYGYWAYVQPAVRSCFDGRAGLAPTLSNEALNKVADRLSAARQEGLPVGASPGFVDLLRRAPDFGDCGDCQAGRKFATVMPEGAIVPCHLQTAVGGWPDGRGQGFDRAFQQLSGPLVGRGCAIAPYQEAHMVLGLQPWAVATALRRLGPVQHRRRTTSATRRA
jgi:MoaA/NifB/PqqE/SkfB family radical SAM enzyme